MAIFQDVRRLLPCSTAHHMILGCWIWRKIWIMRNKISFLCASAKTITHPWIKFKRYDGATYEGKILIFCTYLIQSLVILTVSVWSENESELPLLQHHIETDVFPQNRNPSATAPYINRCETVGDFEHWCGSYFFAFDILSRSPKIVSIKWSTVYLTKL